ncbi:homeodomain-like protein [Tanacetum coccineum]
MCRANSNPDNDLVRTTGGERRDMPSYAASAMRCRNLIIVTTVKAVLREDERAETMSVPVHKESKPKGGLNCGIIDWYDPPMCERVVQIIPGLLNSMNNLQDQEKHIKTLSLDESRSPDFDLFSDQEEYSEEEVAETIAETMEQYMRKTRADYRSGVARPKIEDKGASDREISKRIAENVLVGIGKFVFPIDFIILDMSEDIKVPLILGRQFLSTAHAKIDVFKRKITLKVGEEKIIFKSVKPAGSLIKRVYMLSLRERIELDLEVRHLEARLIGETLVLNRSLDPLFGDYIELNDLNVPLELRRDQVDDLMPTIEEGEVVEEFRARNDARMVSEIFGYPSDCDHDKKIRIDCAHNLKFSCMIGFEFLHANFFPILYVNVMPKKFHNSIMKDKLEYKGNNVVGALMNIPIFVGTFSILTDFAVLEDMDAYRDEGMGDVIFGEPFLREVRINARRFEGMITIYNGNEDVTYQIVWSHPRFKRHTNERCNKIPPLLKVSEEDKMNGISHSYQKLKSFYKGVLN